MIAQVVAKCAAAQTVARGFHRGKIRIVACVALATVGLGGCLQTAPLLAGADPGDPSARVAGAGYRSTTAPYTRMRPTAPNSWSGQDNAAPSAKSDK
jgi:hypothetical protein